MICKFFKKTKKISSETKITPVKNPTPPPNINSRKCYQAASGYIGVKEIPGSQHNPKIQEFHKRITGQELSDETPWCAAFVGFVLHCCGIRHSSSLLARSYADLFTEVPLESAQQGDIVLLWRESPESWKGHVGFVHKVNKTTIEILGGNQSDSVNITKYPIDRVLTVRRVVEV